MLDLFMHYPLLGYLFIFSARTVDVSLGVFRILLLTRGYSLPAAAIGFFEVSIFLLALGTVFSGGTTDFWKIGAYASGFAAGNLLGVKIENFMAVGYVALQIFPTQENSSTLKEELRKCGYGVTTVKGQGQTGPREILMVSLNRKDLPHALALLDQIAPDTFYNASDVRTIRGGVFPEKHL